MQSWRSVQSGKHDLLDFYIILLGAGGVHDRPAARWRPDRLLGRRADHRRRLHEPPLRRGRLAQGELRTAPERLSVRVNLL